ncbi:MAG: endonuclease domain-containing protein [Candidatus Gracilibacteria bacterium]|nr:endonuclease domain-containing protein [Candidatus Gracilibacteria bacterium]
MTLLNNKGYLKNTRKELRNNSTKAEKYLWEYLKGSQLGGFKFRRQHSIGRYILDFYCPKLKVSIELDGEIHNQREEYDNIRTKYIEACGIHEIRFSNQEVLDNIETILQKLKIYIK